MSGKSEKAKRRDFVRNLPPPDLVRTGRAGRRDLAARVPWMASLQDRTVAQFGLGALGAPAALELARSGVRMLRVLDGDYVDPAAASRWPYGVGCAGLPKAFVIQRMVATNWPWTSVHPEMRHLGRVRDQDGEPEGDWVVLQRMLDDAHLVLDATAEFGVSYLLSSLARERSLPYVSISATHGAWGGVVLAIRPSSRGCWSCYQAAVAADALPQPPSDPEGATQPEGCAAPTFRGSAFDLAPMVAEGVRTAISVISEGRANGYPSLDWDVAILALRTAEGVPIPPTWRTFNLDAHPSCTGTHPVG